jgi:beta-lactam-binding protein with PASTA domain
MLIDADEATRKPKRAWVARWKPRLRQFVQRVVKAFNLTFGTLALLAVFLGSAFLAMRLAIHGREVNVPNFAGLSNGDAETLASSLGLNLEVENRFYSSAVAANHVLSQAPLEGNRVRRGWQVRVTESLGAQQVAVPNMMGETERAAAVSLRRLALDAGSVAYLPAPAPVGVVLAQSPPADAASADGPGVSLLVTAEAVPPSGYAYVMPSIVGLTLGTASARLAAAGLHIASAQDPAPEDAGDGSLGQTSTGQAAGDVSVAVPAAAPVTTTARMVIVSQSPLPGRRVTRGDNIRVTLSR